ncbi:MAG: TIGR02444 family protein [Alphaproteobacteria bacterium]|jgi:uncharacterized protein (TIGR02444 family)
MEFPEHPFWDFALRVYRCDGVGQACLNIQSRHGIDVNIMLFCLWLGETGRGVLDDGEMKAVMSASEDWHEQVVKGLRAVRQGMKDSFLHVDESLRTALRADIQATEIDSEHLEQLILCNAISREAGGREAGAVSLDMDQRAFDATKNFDAYLDARGIVFETATANDYAHMLLQAFPGLTPENALNFSKILL